MSFVTSVMLTFSIVEDEVARVDELNAHLAAAAPDRADYFRTGIAQGEGIGGDKAFESQLLVAGFNYLEPKLILAAVEKTSWQRPAEVQVLLREESEPVFTLHALDLR